MMKPKDYLLRLRDCPCLRVFKRGISLYQSDQSFFVRGISTLLVLLLITLILPCYAEGWTYHTNISNKIGRSWYPEIVTYRKNIHVVWEDDYNHNRNILYRKSSDNGEKWSGTKKLSTGSGESPAIAINKNNIYVVWEKSGNIYFSYSINNGENWQKEVKLGSSYGYYYGGNPDIAVEDGIIHVVWSTWSPWNGICYIRSLNNGKSWGSVKYISKINSGVEASANPAISVGNHTVHIVWQERSSSGQYNKTTKLMYRAAKHGGNDWQVIRRVEDSYAYDWDFLPDIKAINNTAHIIWKDMSLSRYTIIYRKTDNYGASWLGKRTLNKPVLGYQKICKTSITAIGQTIYVAWDEKSPTFPYGGIIYNASFDGGNRWGDCYNIAGGESQYPSISVEEGYIHFVWQYYFWGNSSSDYEILYQLYSLN